MPRRPHLTFAARRAAACLSAAVACVIVFANLFATQHVPATRAAAAGVEPRAAVTTAAGPSAAARAAEAFGALPLQFEANRGQTDASVKFLARGGGYNLFLTPGEAVLALHKPVADDAGEGERAELKRPAAAMERAVLRMKLLGSNPSPVVEGRQPLEARSNYFAGGASGQPVSAETYARVRYAGVYDGVDAVYYGNQRQLEYDFVVHPHADPRQIVIAFEGAESVEVGGEGELSVQTPLGEVRQHKPFVYQEDETGARREVAGRYVMRGEREVAFELGDYDASRTLVIDPVLVYSTYHGGGSSLDTAYGVAVDAAGNAYVAGETISMDFPTTADAFQKTYGGSNYDAYVTKLNATGTGIVYSTYLGGERIDQAYDIAVDAAGNAYVAGSTNSSFFPLRNAVQGTLSGKSSDAFVAKLNPQGAALVYSTFLGGTQNDNGHAIALDSARDAYVVGGTTSLGFPTTEGTLRRSRNGQGDAFVSKIHVGEDEPTYKISGRVTGEGGEPLAGVMINIFGGARAQTYTSAEGTYSFDGLRAGTLYSLTAYTPCGSFTTQNDTVNNLSSDQTIDFAGRVTTFTISGYVTNSGGSTRRAGVLMTLSGAQDATATTDANGEYSFQNVPGCRDYTVTPSAPEVFFTKPSRTYTYLSMNQPYTSFTASPLSDNKPPTIFLYSQSATHVAPSTVTLHADASDTTGAVSKVDFYVGGATLIGTDTLTANEAQLCATSFQVQWNADEPGTYVVTAVATDTVGATTRSSPRSFTISTQAEPQPLVSVTSPAMNAVYEMPAAVRVSADAQAVTGRSITKVEFYLADWMGMNLKPLQTDTTAPYGGFELTDLSAGDYSIYAYAYDDAGSVGMTEPYYFSVKAPPVKYSITGRLADANGVPIGGADVALSGAAGEMTTTDADGRYSFENLAAGEEYVILPGKDQYTFEPAYRTFPNLSANATSDFTGTPTPEPPPYVYIAIDAPAYSESAAAVEVRVCRTGDLSTAVTVGYQTSDGTARDGYDYMAARGTLHFAAGEAEKVVRVALIADGYAEKNKAFVLMQYFGYMRRNPNEGPDTDWRGWQFWLKKLDDNHGNFVHAQMVRAFLDSFEYRNRFAP